MNEVVIAVGWVVVVMLANGLLTRPNHGWADTLRVSALRPPRGAFAPGWALILSCAATGGVLGWDHAPDASARAWLVGLFVLNSFLNISWSVLYFLLRRPDWALIEIIFVWLSILALLLFTASFSATASVFLLPYLGWVSFASYLNLRVVQLNGPFGTQSKALNVQNHGMKELFASGHIADFILALIVFEAALVLGWRMTKKSGPAPLPFISNLLAGTFLLLALRGALLGSSWPLISLCLAAGLVSHVINLVITWERA